ncbi:MAG: hypothetical protein J7K68_00270 [Candidatus Diapherotrites archaeon]|nr:hypothetical protein [Candidatus Diapherotrites archaeon]
MGFILEMMQNISNVFGGLCGLVPQCRYIMIGLKIVVLLFLVGWVRNRLGSGLIATIVLLFVGYLILFPFWPIFGPLAIVYLAAMYGALGLIVTFIFAKSHLFPGAFAEADGMQDMQNVRPPGV